MEEIKYSILVCAFCNGKQFRNFLWTATNQDYDPRAYEIQVVDNDTPSEEIEKACMKFKVHKYTKMINKNCRNITQGINYAAENARGKYIVIIADSNVLLSFNLLKEIDRARKKAPIVISGGHNCDVKISLTGDYDSEYAQIDPEIMARTNQLILKEMGWPADPSALKLIPGKYRFPDPHKNFDVYMVAMPKRIFLEEPYNDQQKTWGPYHQDFVRKKCEEHGFASVENARIIHQWHRVWKNGQPSD